MCGWGVCADVCGGWGWGVMCCISRWLDGCGQKIRVVCWSLRCGMLPGDILPGSNQVL